MSKILKLVFSVLIGALGVSGERHRAERIANYHGRKSPNADDFAEAKKTTWTR